VNALSRARWTFSSCLSFFFSLSTSCCSASFRSLLAWILFVMPLVTALADDPFFTGMAPFL
jgi:hypothetical protein